MTGRKFVTKRKFVTDPGHLMAARGLGRGVVIGVRVSGDWFKVACVRARADVHVHPARARIPYSRTDRERRRQMDRQMEEPLLSKRKGSDRWTDSWIDTQRHSDDPLDVVAQRRRPARRRCTKMQTHDRPWRLSHSYMPLKMQREREGGVRGGREGGREKEKARARCACEHTRTK